MCCSHFKTDFEDGFRHRAQKLSESPRDTLNRPCFCGGRQLLALLQPFKQEVLNVGNGRVAAGQVWDVNDGKRIRNLSLKISAWRSGPRPLRSLTTEVLTGGKVLVSGHMLE